MPFSIRPYSRFPMYCAVTYHAGSYREKAPWRCQQGTGPRSIGASGAATQLRWLVSRPDGYAVYRLGREVRGKEAR